MPKGFNRWKIRETAKADAPQHGIHRGSLGSDRILPSAAGDNEGERLLGEVYKGKTLTNPGEITDAVRAFFKDKMPKIIPRGEGSKSGGTELQQASELSESDRTRLRQEFQRLRDTLRVRLSNRTWGVAQSDLARAVQFAEAYGRYFRVDIVDQEKADEYGQTLEQYKGCIDAFKNAESSEAKDAWVDRINQCEQLMKDIEDEANLSLQQQVPSEPSASGYEQFMQEEQEEQPPAPDEDPKGKGPARREGITGALKSLVKDRVPEILRGEGSRLRKAELQQAELSESDRTRLWQEFQESRQQVARIISDVRMFGLHRLTFPQARESMEKAAAYEKCFEGDFVDKEKAKEYGRCLKSYTSSVRSILETEVLVGDQWIRDQMNTIMRYHGRMREIEDQESTS